MRSEVSFLRATDSELIGQRVEEQQFALFRKRQDTVRRGDQCGVLLESRVIRLPEELQSRGVQAVQACETASNRPRSRPAYGYRVSGPRTEPVGQRLACRPRRTGTGGRRYSRC